MGRCYICISSIQLFLKMLIIFCGIPVAAPGEAVFGKEAVAEIVLINLVGEVLAAVSVHLTAGRRDIGAAIAVLIIDHIGVVVGVYVNGKSVGMFGQVRGAVHYPVIEAGSVIIRHGGGVITIVLIDQTDTLDTVIILV